MRITLPPGITALLLQVAAFFSALVVANFSPVEFSTLAFILLCGLLAALYTHFAKLASWWLPIQFMFIPAIAFVRLFDVPPGLFLAAFFILLAVYWSTYRTQVPLYLSSRKIWAALELLLPEEQTGKNFTFVDLGCGLGGVMAHLAHARPDGRYVGVEAAPVPYFFSRLRARGLPNCDVRWGSLWETDLSQYDVVYAYLSPVPMSKLWKKAEREMRPGSVFISNTFKVPDHPAQLTYSVDDLHRSTLHVWRMGEHQVPPAPPQASV